MKIALPIIALVALLVVAGPGGGCPGTAPAPAVDPETQACYDADCDEPLRDGEGYERFSTCRSLCCPLPISSEDKEKWGVVCTMPPFRDPLPNGLEIEVTFEGRANLYLNGEVVNSLGVACGGATLSDGPVSYEVEYDWQGGGVCYYERP